MIIDRLLIVIGTATVIIIKFGQVDSTETPEAPETRESNMKPI